MGRPLHNPPIARAAWPTLLARPGHLFLALIITILSALPAAAQSTPADNNLIASVSALSSDSLGVNMGDVPTTNGESLIFPTGTNSNYLINLSRAGVVSGITEDNWEDFNITSSNTKVITIEEQRFCTVAPGSSIVTYTHKDNPDISFYFKVFVKESVGEILARELTNICMGDTAVINLENEIPVENFSFVKANWGVDKDVDFKIEMNGNYLTIIPLHAGSAPLDIIYTPYKSYFSHVFTISDKTEDLPSIKVLEDSIVVPVQYEIGINELIKGGVLEGSAISVEDYAVTSTFTGAVDYKDGAFVFFQPGSGLFTFTHKSNPKATFNLNVTAKRGANFCVYDSLGTVYLGESKSLTIPGEYISLDDYVDIYKAGYQLDGYPNADCEVSREGNTLIFKGLGVGRCVVHFKHRFGIYEAVIEIAKKPSKEDIVVNDSVIVVPSHTVIFLNTLKQDKVVEGVSGCDDDYAVTSTNADVLCHNPGSFLFSSVGSSKITFTHKELPDVSFDLIVTAKRNPADYVTQNLGTVYLNESKTIHIPEDCMPLDEFTEIIQSAVIWTKYPNAAFDVSRNGNSLTITGRGEGRRNLLFRHKYGNSNATITIAEKPAAPVEIYLPESGSDEINGYSYEINQWNDAVTFTGEAPEETTTFVVPLKCNLNGYTLSIDDNYGAAVFWPVTAKLIDNNTAIEFTVKNKYDAAYTVQHYNTFVRLLATSPDGEEDNPWRFYFRLSNDAVKVGVNPTVESADSLTSISINEDKNTIIGSYPAKGSSMTIVVPDMPDCPDYKSNVRVVNPQGMPTINDLATIATTDRGTEIKLPLPETSLDSLVYRVDLLLKNDSLTYILWQANMYLTTVKEKPAVEKVEIAADDEKTQELIESGVIAIIDPNEPDAPTDPDKPAPEITFTPAVETKDETTGEIVSVEPELLTFTVTSQVEEIPLKVETKEMESVEGRYVAVSSNEAVAVATLDENGNLVIKRNATIGTARIIIIFVETPAVASRSRSISARESDASEPLKEIIVQVNPAAETTLVLSEQAITLTEGSSIAIAASLKDAEGNDYEQEFSVEWSSSDTGVATVDEQGTITAIKAGKATITATCGKLSASCEVTVSEPEAPEVTEINLDTEKISGVEGSTYHLQADVDDLTWSSSDESVAVVDQNGIVTLVGAGRAIITATATNGVKATCEVVVEAASGINGVEADTEAAFAPVYDLTGRLVARTPEQMAALRAGIYIQAGRKIYISK